MEHTNTLCEQTAVFSFKPYSTYTNQQVLRVYMKLDRHMNTGCIIQVLSHRINLSYFRSEWGCHIICTCMWCRSV